MGGKSAEGFGSCDRNAGALVPEFPPALLVDCVLGARGGPEDRGDVGAKGSSKIVSVCVRLVFIDGGGESTVSAPHIKHTQIR